MSWRGSGKRARGRRDQDGDLDNTAWLEELEKAAAEQDDNEDEEEWASKLRRRRSQEPEPPPLPDPPGRAPEPPRTPVAHDLSPYPPLGSEPAAPPPPPRPAPGPAREPDYRLLGMEPDTGRQGADWDAGWDAGSSARPAPAPDWTARDPSPGTGSAAGWTSRDPSPGGAGAAEGWTPRDPSPGTDAADGWTARDPSPATGAHGVAGDPGTDWSAWEPEGTGPPRPAGRPEGFGRGSPGDPANAGGGAPREPPDPVPRWDEPRGPGGPGGSPVGRAPVDRGYDLGEPDWRPAGPDAATGAWSPAEPVGREPDYPALFGELNRRSAAQREALWDSAPAPAPAQEPYDDPGSPDPPAPTWPFEDTTGTWEPSDRSFIWPAEELPAAPSEWEPSTPSWLDEPTAQPPAWQAGSAGTATPAPPPVPPDDWAAGIQSGVPPAAPAGRVGDAAARQWRPDEAVYGEPAVPLGANGTAPPRPSAERVQMAEPADQWESYERPRSSWPKVVALVSWIVLLMVVCWFYVFPWLEQVLPENF
jgi:hypothetical protein